jgi:type IV pilus assembly protein PilM
MAGTQVSWGLDVGTTSLKAIKLARSGEKVTIEAFDVVEHDKFLSEPDIDRDAIIRTSLAKFLERNPVRRDQLFVGVPGSQTFARFVKLPPVEPKKIPEIVKFEAIQQVPFPLDQVNWDYQTFQSPESPDVEVGIFAMKKELVAQVLSNFQAHKLTTSGVQMSPLAVFNAVEFDQMTDSKGTVVLDIGAEHTDLIFIDHGRLWLRTINIGGNNFTDALAKSFRLSFNKAEELKKTAATSKYARQVYQSMRPVFADLVVEIQRSIGFYNSSHRDSRLERVVGMGNPFKLPNLQKYLAQNLSMEVIRIESFKKATSEGKIAAGLNEHILGMPAAYGLALQGLDLAEINTNLLPIEIAREMLWRKKRPWFIAAAALIAVGVGAAGFRTLEIDMPAFANATASPEHKANEAGISAINSFKQIYGSIPNTYDADKIQALQFVNLSNDRAIWPNIIHDIISALPQNEKSNAKSLLSPNVHDHRAIIIKSIDAQYANNVDAAEAAAAAALIAGGVSAPAAGSATPAAAAAGAAASGPITGNRGFVITIKGYTPLTDHGQARNLIRDYLKTIADTAPQPSTGKVNPSRPYYYTVRRSPPPYVEKFIASSGSDSDIVWGADTSGPFAAAFVPELLGITPSTQPAVLTPGHAPDAPIDRVTEPREPGSGDSMVNDDEFTLQFAIRLVDVGN